MKVLRAENIRKTYGRKVKTVAVDGFSYTFEPGRSYAVVGPSGSGKTTLLYLLSGIEVPESGRVIYGDTNLTVMGDDALARFRAAHFSFVFQQFYLIPYLNAYENVSVGLYLKTGRTDRDKAIGILRSLGIEDPTKMPYEYSGGEQQRIAIARALITEPEVIFADEPTGNLDSKNSEMVFRLLTDLTSEGRTVIIATHDLELAGMCDVVLRLRDGRLVK